jgi:hypothetical protein
MLKFAESGGHQGWVDLMHLDALADGLEQRHGKPPPQVLSELFQPIQEDQHSLRIGGQHFASKTLKTQHLDQPQDALGTPGLEQTNTT